MTGSIFPGGLRPDGLPAALSDPRRIAAVLATGLLDTEPEQPFDDLAEIATAITGCERAFITLVDEDRSFWKSCVGVDIQQTGGRQNPVRESFCYFLVGLGDRFVVEDAAEDQRTRHHPSVAPMKIGAWAGYSILGPAGEVLGSMCVIDENPHPWQPAELAALGTLARRSAVKVQPMHAVGLGGKPMPSTWRGRSGAASGEAAIAEPHSGHRAAAERTGCQRCHRVAHRHRSVVSA